MRTYNILLGEDRAVGRGADRRRLQQVKPESAQFAAEQLRGNDRDRYFATLVLPDNGA